MMYGVCEFDIDYDDKPKHLVKFETLYKRICDAQTLY